MPERTGRCRRPFLAIGRDTARAACDALHLEVWDDPHNFDSRYARARVRHQALPTLEATLGPGIAEALARTAGQLRADADALDELARQAADRLRLPDSAMSVADLAALPAALRTRVLRRTAILAGCRPGSLAATHIERLDELLTGWHGQRWVDLPSGVRGVRQCGKLRFIAGSRTGENAAGIQDTEDADGRERHGSRPEGGADQPRAAASAHRGTRRPD
jgi:tRNA(Ile)-lysidine synthase